MTTMSELLTIALALAGVVLAVCSQRRAADERREIYQAAFASREAWLTQGRREGAAAADERWRQHPLYAQGYRRGIGEAVEIQAEMDALRQRGELAREIGG